jgi:hypothetical protein
VERSRTGSGKLAAVVAVVALAGVLAGCGAPEYTYVRDNDGATYFKVPSAWRQVDQKALEGKVFGDSESATAAQQKQLTWTIAYDAHTTPSAEHLLTPAPETEDRPFALAKVQNLTEPEQNGASLNMLRNSIGLPVAVDDETRQQMESSDTYPFKSFELLADEVLPVENGIRGVRSIFNFRLPDGPVQTFDQTAYLSADGKQVSTLLVKCSARCYKERVGEIDLVAQSFKVKRLTP